VWYGLLSQKCVRCSGSADGGQSEKGKGVAPETKHGGKKDKSKMCAKDGCGALIEANKQCSRCSQCSVVYYCSRDCQRTDWKVHKPKCNAAVEEKAAQDAQANKQTSTRVNKLRLRRYIRERKVAITVQFGCSLCMPIAH
jgi:hypothetical protein